MDYQIIDPPGPYASVEELEAWLKELDEMEPTGQVAQEKAKTLEYLERAKAIRDNRGR